jgi:hypothetical protein
VVPVPDAVYAVPAEPPEDSTEPRPTDRRLMDMVPGYLWNRSRNILTRKHFVGT